MIRTKIVATMGPACGEVETLHSLFQAGVDVCRLNFSHGDLDGHLQMLRNVREAAARWSQPIAVLGDLCGPKIASAKSPNTTGWTACPSPSAMNSSSSAPCVGQDHRVSSIYPRLVDDVEVGHRLLIEDGLLRFICTEKNFSEIRCNCTIGGVLRSSKGINLPDTRVNVPSITDRDWECIDWAIENDLDYLALSFVRSAQDMLLLREHLRNKSADIHLIAKIEKAEALDQIDEILEASDGLMIARGDLGVEMDVAQVPIIQKDLVRRCQTAGKPVIVATQMLQSMIEQASPTRAEVSDVANAIFDGTDAVMLSGETAVGKFPLGTVHTMAHVAEVTEEYLIRSTAPPPLPGKTGSATLRFSSAIARGVREIVADLNVTLVVVWSQTGATARIFSKGRFPVPLVALSSEHGALRKMALHFGVIPHEMAPPQTMLHLVQCVDAMVQEAQLAALGDRIIIVAGAALRYPRHAQWNHPAHRRRTMDRRDRSPRSRRTGRRCIMKPALIPLAAIALLFALGGCAVNSKVAPPSTRPAVISAPAVQATADYWFNRPAVVSVASPDFYRLWNACAQTLIDDQYEIDEQNQRLGILMSYPMISKQFFEFWRSDAGTLGEILLDSLQTIHRTVRFELIRRPDGSYLASPKVLVEQSSHPERRLTVVAQFTAPSRPSPNPPRASPTKASKFPTAIGTPSAATRRWKDSWPGPSKKNWEERHWSLVISHWSFVIGKCA